MTEEIVELWSKFHKLTLAISIDDTEDRYEYVRYPGKWSKILTNLGYVAEAISKHPDVFSIVNIVAVVNFFTAYNFSKLAAVGQQFGINVSKLISTGPVYTTPTILTDEEKNHYAKLIPQDEHRSELINYLNQFTFSEDSRQQFFHMLKFWDSKRRKTFAQVFPELAEILKISPVPAV
jgi:hypothetical protein